MEEECLTYDTLAAQEDTLCIPGLEAHKAYDTQAGIIDFDQTFFKGNPLLHPELPFQSQGVSATPLPYSLWRDDLVASGLLLCLFLFVHAFKRIRPQLRQQTKDFFSQPKERTGLFAIETSIESRSRWILIFQLCLIGGLTAFAYIRPTLDILPGQRLPLYLLGFYVA